MQSLIKVHWSRSKPNFGDSLSPLVCEAVSGKKIIYSPIKDCDLLAIGSLLQRLPENLFSRKINVWGSGFIQQEKPHNSKHIYHTLRGSLSNEIIKNQNIISFGDPGLLADLLINSFPRNKKYKLGIVEHYKDRNHPIVKKIIDSIKYTTLIDVYLPPILFLDRLSECDVIFSSAMHGLIAADSLNIPNIRIKLSENLRGGDFKFNDYYSIYDFIPTLLQLDINNLDSDILKVTEEYRRSGIEEIKKGLLKTFPSSF